MAALTVRIDVPHTAAIKRLRKEGVNVSELIRRSILQADEHVRDAKSTKTWNRAAIDSLLVDIDAILGDEAPAFVEKGVDIRDRKSRQDFIRRQLTHKGTAGRHDRH